MNQSIVKRMAFVLAMGLLTGGAEMVVAEDVRKAGGVKNAGNAGETGKVGGVVGWRTDGTGMYEQAEPALSWSTRDNVAWATDVSGWSNSTPVVVGDRIFVCSEPSMLVCLDRESGRVLWQQSNDLIDTVPAGEVEVVKQQLADAQAMMAAQVEAEGQLNRIRRQLRRNKDDEALKAKSEALGQEIAGYEKKLGALNKFRRPRTHDTNGYSSPTPVSDGEFVYALFGNGVAACYDMAGNRQWIRQVESVTAGWGQSSSPALVDGVLVLLINQLHGLDAATGETNWTVPSHQNWGTPVAVKIDGRDIVITPTGQVIEPTTGELLATNIGKLHYAAPTVIGNVVYFIEKKSVAVRLGFDDDGTLSVDELWFADVKGSRHYSSPIVHGGLIYAISREGAFTLLESSTGKIVYEKSLDFEGGTNAVYPSVTLAGGYIFLTGEAGKTMVIKPGRTWQLVSTNQLEKPLRGSPVFDQTYGYFRSGHKLYCVENVKTAGR